MGNDQSRLSPWENVLREGMGAGGDLAGGQPIKLIAVNQSSGAGRVPYRQNRTGCQMIDDLIVRDLQTGIGINATFLTARDDNRILRQRPLLDEIFLNQCLTAVREINAVASRAIWAILNA